MKDERSIGFIQGVAYAASLLQQYRMNGEQLMRESNIPNEDFVKYADEHDLEILGLLKKK